MLKKNSRENPIFLLLFYWLIAIAAVLLIDGWNPLTRQIISVQIIPMALSLYTFSTFKKV